MPGLLKSFIFTLLVGTTIVYSNQLLDYFHHSRFLFFGSVIGVFSFLMFFKNELINLRITRLTIILITFCIISFLSVLWAQEKTEAWFVSLKALEMLSIYFLCRIAFERVQTEILLNRIRGLSLGFTIVILSIVTYEVSALYLDTGVDNEGLYDLQVLYGHKSFIAAFIFLLIPINLLGKPGEIFNWKILPVVLWQTIVILLIQSRSMYLALFVGFLILGYYLFSVRSRLQQVFGKGKIIGAGIVCILFFSLLLSSEGFRERLNPTLYFKSQTATERQLVWIKSIPLIRDNFLTGVGAGNWKIEFPGYGVDGSYRMQDQNVFFTRMHNDFLEIFAELGIFGLVSYMLLFAMVLYLLHLGKKDSPWISRILLVGIVGFLISSLIDFPRERIAFLIMLGFYIALIEKLFETHHIFQNNTWGTKSLFVIMLLGSAFILYTGYHRYRGERFTKIMLKARDDRKWDAVIDYSSKAKNFFHKMDPSSIPIDFHKGLAHYQRGESVEAEKSFLKAHSICPYNFHVLNNLATIDLERNNYNKAAGWLKEALRINPRFVDALYNLSYCYTRQGKYDEALQVLESVPGDPEKKVLYRRQILAEMKN